MYYSIFFGTSVLKMNCFTNSKKILSICQLIIWLFIFCGSSSAQTITKRYNISNQTRACFVSGSGFSSFGAVFRDMLCDIPDGSGPFEDKYGAGGVWTEYSDGTALVSGGFVNLDNNQTTFSFNFKLSGRSTDPGGYHSGCFPTEPPPPDFYKYTTMDYYTMTGTGATTSGLVIAGNSISANAFQLGSRGGSVYCTCFGAATWMDFNAVQDPNNKFCKNENGEFLADIYFRLDEIVCGVSDISANVSACDLSNNLYSVNGTVSYTNPPSDGTLNIYFDGTLVQQISPPFTTNSNYNITGFYSDGATHTIRAEFTSIPTCTRTINITAPDVCKPPCSVSNFFNSICHINGSLSDPSDDFIQTTITGQVINGSGSYVVKVGAYTSAPVLSNNSITIYGNGQFGNPLFLADGVSTYLIRVEDALDAACFTTFTLGPVSSCAEYYDWGDLYDNDDNSSISYPTNMINAGEGIGPSHKIIPGLKIGAVVDFELDGQPSATAIGDGADEDGVTLPMLEVGTTATIPVSVMNMTTSDAKLTLFIDFNRDGDLNDAGEMTSATIISGTNGTVNLTIAVPSDAVTNLNLGVRARLSTDFAASMLSEGAAPDGEVEDYYVQVMAFDHGDLPDSGVGTSTNNYETQSTSNGPVHKIISGLKIGAIVDPETDGAQSTLANGDDNNTTDDEDAVLLPVFYTGANLVIPVSAMNMTGSTAKLTMFIDYNGDGDFVDVSEMSSAMVPTGTNGTINLNTSVPLTAITGTNLGLRLRISTDQTTVMQANGYALDGEIEDYIIQIQGPNLVHSKTVASVTQVDANEYNVVYNIDVQNTGLGIANYDLRDIPFFDDDVTIQSAGYTSDAPSNPGTALALTPTWTLATNQNILGNTTHHYVLTVSVFLNLTSSTSGDRVYHNCTYVTSPATGRALFNQVELEYLRNSTIIETKDACVDLPYITHEKTLTSVTHLGGLLHRVVYQIKVDNIGGAQGSYDLSDIPEFDNDIQILNANYVTNAMGNPGNPSAFSLSGSGPWVLANNQTISASSSQIYTLTVNVQVDLVDPLSAGDEIYRACGSTVPGRPSSGEGLFNRTSLDVNNDGTPDQRDTVCADISIWDLALKKTLLTPAPYRYGQTVNFEIKVYNQGNEIARNIEVSDYIPEGYTFVANNGWIGTAPTIRRIIAGPLNPRDSIAIPLQLTIVMTDGGTKNWINYAEITASRDNTNVDRTMDDKDSMAGSDGTAERAVLPGAAADNNITSVNKGGEEDDHDPAGIQIMDLAIKKVLNESGPFRYGDQVTHRIRVYNQGSLLARDIRVVDYIPQGMRFDATSSQNSIWVFDASTAMATSTILQLNPGDSVDILIDLIVQSTQNNFINAWKNEVEIKSATNQSGTVLTSDIDSDFDMNPNNDNDPSCGSSDDDEINEDGKNIPNQDQDDNDISCVPIFDLALKKYVITAPPYSYNQAITFGIKVFNQGNTTASDFEITDYIPSGYQLADANWALSGSQAKRMIITDLLPGDSTIVQISLRIVMTNGGEMNWDNYAEISRTSDSGGDNTNEDADSNPGSNSIAENNVKPNSTNDDNITSTNRGGEEDDHDPAGIDIIDLALRKVVDESGPFRYGDQITNRIRVFNQGNHIARDIRIVDYLPSGLQFDASSSRNIAWVYDPTTRMASTSILRINPGDSADILIDVILLASTSNQPLIWKNEAEIKSAVNESNTVVTTDIDSRFDMNPDNDNEPNCGDSNDDEIHEDGINTIGADQDDNDISCVPVFDLALKKIVITAPPYQYHQTITFGIKVFNQGNIIASDFEITDYIPSGYQLADPTWTATGNIAKKLITTDLLPGDSTIIDIILRLVMTAGGESNWDNYAQITTTSDPDGPNPNDDADSNPNSNNTGETTVKPNSPNDDNTTSTDRGGEEDDHDPAGIDIFDLALRKLAKPKYPIRYNDTINFEITVFNQGNVIANNATLVDYIPIGYQWIPNINWIYDPATRMATLVTNQIIRPADSIKLNLNLIVLPNFSGASVWDNLVEIKSAIDENSTPITNDIDSDFDMNPNDDMGGIPNSNSDNHITDDGNDTDNDGIKDDDDHDPARPEIIDFALRKWVPNEKPYYIPGEQVDFIISLHNQGNVSSSNIKVKDYLPAGFQFTASTNPGWIVNGVNLEYNHSSRLNPKDSVQIHLKLIVIVPPNATLSSWENYAEIANIIDTLNRNRDSDDADSRPNSDTPYERSVHDKDPFDNVIDGNGQLRGPNEDEDDHDPEAVVVTAYLGDKVWKDLDGDGMQDNNELPLQGVIATIYNCKTGAVVKRDTTDINGIYGFEALLGDESYFVRFDASPLNMPNCAWTFPNKANGNDRLDSDVNTSGITPCYHLDWGERDSTVDAGFVELSKYGDYVWHDRDVDGMQDSAEEGLAGYSVILYDANTNFEVKRTVTNNQGKYLFEELMPTIYYAKFELNNPSDWRKTDVNVGPDFKDCDVDNSNGLNTTATTYLSPGEDDRTWDAGLWQCAVVSGDVWYDLNKDGIYQTIENGINGLTVYLVNANTHTIVERTITTAKPGTPSDDGYYVFPCVRPGNYFIRYDRPGHLAASEAFQGSDRNKDSHVTHAFGPNTSELLVLSSGQKVFYFNAGFQEKSTVGNFVWLDANYNGIQDKTENPVEGVKVMAINANGTIVSESTTGVDGNYFLDGISQGDYYIKFIPQKEYQFTRANVGFDLSDSDVNGDHGLGTTSLMRVNTGDSLSHVDAGLVLSILSVEWLDFNVVNKGYSNQLSWITSNELNNSHFVIERRLESEKNFREIAIHGASTDVNTNIHYYTYDDYELNFVGNYYYRIKQVDKNGSVSYSKIVTITMNHAEDFNCAIFPNPAQDEINLDLFVMKDGYLEATVFTADGVRTNLTMDFGFKKAGLYKYSFSLIDFVQGQYILQLKNEENILYKKFAIIR